MKPIPLTALLFIVSLLAGCNKYQYFSVTSQLPEQIDGSFKFEDDSVYVIYSLNPNGHLNIEVFNKLDEIIYWDLEKSSMIFNSESYTFFGNSSFEGTSLSYEDFGRQEGTFSGSLNSTPNGKYIPPGTKVSHQFKNVPIDYRNLTSTDAEKVLLSNGIAAKVYAMNEGESWNTFQSFLYLSDANEVKQQLTHHFRIAQIVETSYKNPHIKLNQFERSKATAAGDIMTIAGIGGLFVLAAVVHQNEESE